jgi:peptide deformylase
MEEGCLTWPNKTILAKRYPKITVSFWTQDGSFVKDFALSDYEAQVWQHEVCHLEGIEEKFKPNQGNRSENKVGRNSECPCGSGKKYKKCCGKQF